MKLYAIISIWNKGHYLSTALRQIFMSAHSNTHTHTHTSSCRTEEIYYLKPLASDGGIFLSPYHL